MINKHPSIQSLIGNTPLVRLKSFENNNNQLYAKLEGQNPAGSVKDRAAYNMISQALQRGDIQKGDTLVEATSGNTGIALAMIASIFEVKMKLVMPDTATSERIKSMEAYGAEVILTPGEKTIEYSRTYAEELRDSKGFYMLNQFANMDNRNMHKKTTGTEIWRDTEGKITHFVSAMGTTGTIMGVSEYVKSQNPAIQIIGTQPKDGSKIPGIRRWSKEFLPKIYDSSRVDHIVDVSREEAIQHTRLLAKQEGILAGMSSGGALCAAIQSMNTFENGFFVFIVCDRGDRYLSSDLFSEENSL